MALGAATRLGGPRPGMLTHRVFHAACAALTFCLAVSNVNGGNGGFVSEEAEVDIVSH